MSVEFTASLPGLHPVIAAGLAVTGQTLASQQALLEFIAGIRTFRSVVEFGCGRASWLNVSRRLGATEILGYDGCDIPIEERALSPAEFVQADLSQLQQPGRKFDLAICVEGAQQVEADSASRLVRTLCGTSDWVLFSAAIPFQQGPKRHANERWIGSWARMFAENGLNCYDILRLRFWHDTRIAFYYRQSACLFVRPGAHYSLKARGYEPAAHPPALVHPEMYLRAASLLPDRPDAGRWAGAFYQQAGHAIADRAAGRAANRQGR